MKKLCKNQIGFTLVEVLIAVAILSIAILGAVAMQISSTIRNSNALSLTRAVSWGSDSLETLMNIRYDKIEDGNNDGIAGLNNTGGLADSRLYCNKHGLPANFFDRDDSTDDPSSNFTIFWNVANDYPIFGTKTIRVITQRIDRGTLKTVSQDFTMMEPI